MPLLLRLDVECHAGTSRRRKYPGPRRRVESGQAPSIKARANDPSTSKNGGWQTPPHRFSAHHFLRIVHTLACQGCKAKWGFLMSIFFNASRFTLPRKALAAFGAGIAVLALGA